MTVNQPNRRPADRRSMSYAADLPELLTVRDLEARFKISRKTIYGYVQRGLIPYVKIQSNVRFRVADILDWLERQSYHAR